MYPVRATPSTGRRLHAENGALAVSSLILKASLAWLLIAAAETVHGILRVRLLNRRMGDRRARQVGVLSGSMIILTITWLVLPWLKVEAETSAWVVGAVWLTLMLAFDIGVGRLAFRMPWKRVAADFDPTKGGLLAFGMVVLLVAPLVVGKLQRAF